MIRFNELNGNANVRSDGRHVAESVGWLATTVRQHHLPPPAMRDLRSVGGQVLN
ncbi:hypothetical protein [Streptomyces chartreusis]